MEELSLITFGFLGAKAYAVDRQAVADVQTEKLKCVLIIVVGDVRSFFVALFVGVIFV